MIDLITRHTRKVLCCEFINAYAVAGLVFLLTVCYQIPSSSMIWHKEGVIHNNAFENIVYNRHTKNDSTLFFDLQGTSVYDPLTYKMRRYEIMYVAEKSNYQILDCFLSEQKTRDGPV